MFDHRLIARLLPLVPALIACSSPATDTESSNASACVGCTSNAAGGAAGSGAMPAPGAAGFPGKAGSAGGAGKKATATGGSTSAAQAGASGASAGAAQGNAGGAAGKPQGAAGSSQGTAGTSQGTAGTSQGTAGTSQGTAGAPQGSAGSPSGSAGASQGAAGSPNAPGDKRVIGYFTAWGVYGRDYHVTDIPAASLTHINYAFANISPEGECVLGDPYADTDKAYPGDTWDPGAKRGSFHQLELLKQQHPKLRTMISIGGWTWSARFSDVALTAASRKKFASSCVAFMTTWGFDGLDIDWEYPVTGGLDTNQYRPEDGHNYTLLLAELRQALDAEGATKGRHFELSIAAPSGPSIYAHMELGALSQSTDFINLMTYDFNGGWSDRTAFNAPLYAVPEDPTADASVRESFNTHSTVTAFAKAGVPKDKIVVGVPFYGRGWSGVTAKNGGLFQPFSGLPQGTWEAGIYDYHDLQKNYVPTLTRSFHDTAKVPWLFDAAKGVMISYDDPQSIAIKGEYVKQQGLGGAMLWELSGDDAQSSLLGALVTSLK